MSKFLRILLISLLALSAVAFVVFYVQNSTGMFALSNMTAAMSSTNMLDVLLVWAYILIFVAIALVLVLSSINMAGNRKALKRAGLILLLTIVLVGGSFLLAGGAPVAVNLAIPPTTGELKLTDTLLNLTYILMGCTIIALVWGSVKKIIQNR